MSTLLYCLAETAKEQSSSRNHHPVAIIQSLPLPPLAAAAMGRSKGKKITEPSPEKKRKNAEAALAAANAEGVSRGKSVT